MKTNHILRIIGFSLITIISGLLFTGCYTYRAYTGPALPKDQVANLRICGKKQIFGKWEITEIPHVLSVDGKSALILTNNGEGGFYASSVEMLPGQHTIEFVLLNKKNECLRDHVIKTISFEAGKTYKVIAYLTNVHEVSPYSDTAIGGETANLFAEDVYRYSYTEYYDSKNVSVYSRRVYAFDWTVEISE